MEGRTGFESFRVTMIWQVSPAGLPLDITGEQLTQRVDDTLQMCSETSDSSFRAVLSKLQEFVPAPQRVNVEFRTSKLDLPINVPLSGVRAGLRMGVNTAGMTSNDAHNFLFVRLPAFTVPVKLDGQHHSPDMHAHIFFNLEGQFPPEELYQETVIAEQMCHVFQIVHRISAKLLEDRGFHNLKSLATSLVDAVCESRHELSESIEVRLVQLTAHLRSGLDYTSAPAMEKVQLSRTVGSNVIEEATAHIEPLEINRLMLDQVEETESAEETDLELQPAETTLSILERRDDVKVAPEQFEPPVTTNLVLHQEEETDMADERGLELQPAETTLSILDQGTYAEAVSEQGAVDMESHTTVSELTKLDDDAKGAQKQGENGYQPKDGTRTAYIALGSNVGDRLNNIENACRELDADPDIRIVRTSPLYETNPMYVADQDFFLNGACKVTRLRIN